MSASYFCFTSPPASSSFAAFSVLPRTEAGLEVLVHIGLDTVSLEGKPFTVRVTEGQQVDAGDLLATADLGAIRDAGRETTTVVVFTNGDAIKSVKLEQTGSLAAKTAVAKVEL